MVLVATIALLSFVGRPQESADSSLANGPGGTTLQEEVRALHQRITTLQDDSRALFQRACEGDDTNGCQNLGFMLYTGEDGATQPVAHATLISELVRVTTPEAASTLVKYSQLAKAELPSQSGHATLVRATTPTAATTLV